jgi:nucleoid DNA-binding protein
MNKGQLVDRLARRTGREIEIPARRACVFTPRKGLRSSMKDMVGA